MTLMTMNDKLILRHWQIDRDHQELFDAIELLILAVESGKKKRSGINIANELLNRARRHFAMEEALMRQHRLSQTTSHNNEHASFIVRVLDVINKLEAGHGTFFVGELNQLRDWLGTHITQTDKALVAELRNQND